MVLVRLLNNLSDARRVTTLFRYFSWKARVLGTRTTRNFNHGTLTSVRAKLFKKRRKLRVLQVYLR